MKKWMVIAIIVAIAAIGGFIYYADQQAGSGVSVDFHRIVGLRNLQQKLEMDKNKLGFYPPELNPSEAVYLDRGDTIPGREGPWGVQKIDFQYAVNAGKTDYVLGVRLDDATSELNSQVLNETSELDGIVYGIDCNDPVYCLGGKK